MYTTDTLTLDFTRKMNSKCHRNVKLSWNWDRWRSVIVRLFYLYSKSHYRSPKCDLHLIYMQSISLTMLCSKDFIFQGAVPITISHTDRNLNRKTSNHMKNFSLRLPFCLSKCRGTASGAIMIVAHLHCINGTFIIIVFITWLTQKNNGRVTLLSICEMEGKN